MKPINANSPYPSSTSCIDCYAEQGRLHAARSLASGLSQFINTTATTLVHHGTIQIELQEACKTAFDRYTYWLSAVRNARKPAPCSTVIKQDRSMATQNILQMLHTIAFRH